MRRHTGRAGPMQVVTGYEKRRARIEMVPLLDVVFLLLVFFIYAMLSMSVHRGIDVALPEARGTTELVDSFPFIITVTKENTLHIEKTPVTVTEAVRYAVDQAATGGRKVLIHADRQADIGVAIELLSRLRTEGLNAVSFLVKDTSEQTGYAKGT